MIASVDFRSIVIGAATLIVGYFVCVLSAIGLTYSGSAPGWTLVPLLGLAIFVSAFSGFISALFAPAKPLIHGALGPAAGASVLLGITLLGASALRQPVGFGDTLPFVATVT